MESLYAIACDSTVDLHTRYNAIKIMQYLRQVEPVNHEKRKRKRDYQAEYRRRKEIWGVSVRT